MARSGARVVLVSSSATASAARDEVMKRGGSSEVHLLVANMSLQSSVRELARQINQTWGAVSALVHHGAHHDLRNPKREVTSEGFERFWAHNQLGPFLLTHLLRDALIKGHGRVVTVGSTRLKVYPRLSVDTHDPNFQHRSFSPTRAFYQSKVAQTQFALAFARHWAGTPVTAKAVCVPSVGADTVRRGKLPWYRRLAHSTGGKGRTTPRKIGELYTVLALSPKAPKIAGLYLDRDLHDAWAPTGVWDTAAQDAVWKVSAAAVGVGSSG
jgi:NAD(P)-dependent dehydrogenase (short-subunit alcohol dehydrogenase family)